MATRAQVGADHYDFSDVDICLMSAGGEVSKEWSPKIGAQGAVVIDNSSAWRMDPEVDRAGGERCGHRRLPQEEHHRQSELLDRPVGGGAEAAARQGQDQWSSWRPINRCPAPAEGMDELDRQTKAIYCCRSGTKKFPKRIAFNVIPHIDVFMEDGYTKEEWKMVETNHQAHRHLRARAGVRRPFRGGQHRV
jgi:aspartate-semialdehyde dehydrogenase